MRGISNSIIGDVRQRKYTVLLMGGSNKSTTTLGIPVSNIDNDASEISLSASDYYLSNEKDIHAVHFKYC